MTETHSAKTASVDYVAVLLQYAEQQGLKAEQLLDSADIDSAMLTVSNSYISTSQYQRLVEQAVVLLDEPALALKLGQRQHLATHGALGYAIMSSSSLEQALQLIRRFICTRNRLIHFNFFLDDHQAVTQIEVKHPIDALYRHCVELAFSSMITVSNSLAGKQHQPCQLTLCYPRPAHHKIYQQLFHTTPQFNAEINEIRLPMAWFKGVNLVGNPLFAQFAQQQCEELLAILDTQNDLQDQVHSLLTHTPGYMPSQEEVAKQLGLSSRSLSRQLAQRNTSFQKILNHQRQKLAMGYLCNRDRSIEEVAYLLGYESPPNFTRAFKRWTGLTPMKYRQQHNNPKK